MTGDEQHPQTSERGRFATIAGWLSAACAVHCLLMPVLAGAAPVALKANAASLDQWLVPGVVGTALLSAGAAYARHRKLRLLAWALCGLFAFVLGHWLEHERAVAFGGVAGAVLLSVSMFVTARQLHTHDDERCAH